jgi:transposase
MGVLKMSQKERERKVWLEMAKKGQLSLKQVSQKAGLSYRQTLRLWERYCALGDAGLVHRGRDRQSNRRHPHQEAILTRYQERYMGFGPTLACEYLAEDGFLIDHETLRRLLLKHGLWSKARQRNPFRRSREPREQFGELVQIDGSIHDWFCQNRLDCLINMVDDATSISEALLDYGETTAAVFKCLWQWIEKYGIPLALYVDLKSVYVSCKKENFSHVQKACDKLNIQIIKAYSPQAKGRVERKHAVYQDRLVKALKLGNITQIPQANKFIEQKFLNTINTKFSRPAKNPQSAHRPLGNIDLNQILCWEYTRQVQHDWTFSFNSDLYQISKEYGSLVKPKSKVIVRKHLNGLISAWHNEQQLSFTQIDSRSKAENSRKPQIKEHCRITKPIRALRKPTPWQQTNSQFFRHQSSWRPHPSK